MHYYPFNIEEYTSHTVHLSEMEDLAYRRMLDYCYLHEIPLPLEVEEIAKKIRMRTHCDCIAYVLREFFEETEHGWINQRAFEEIAIYQGKSKKAKKSADIRWAKHRNKIKDLKDNNANALRTHCEGNANKEQRTKNKEQKRGDSTESLPENLNLEAWKIWTDYRKKAKLKPYVTNQKAKELAKISHGAQMECVKYSVGQNYAGLFPERFKDHEITKISNIDYGEGRGEL